MNLPNKLTILRIIMVPVAVAMLLIEFPYHWLCGLIVFALASFTDMLDGHIARKHHMVTDFGKFADPLADKILVFSVLICFLDAHLASTVVVIVLLFREFLVTAVRLSAAAGGKVVPASFCAKAKTVSQMVAIIIALLLMQAHAIWPAALSADLVFWVSEGLLWVSAVFSIVSGVQYVIHNWEFIKTAK